MFHRREDYLIKMFQSLGLVSAALLNLRRTRKYDEGHSLITNATKETVGLDPILVQKLAPQAIMHMLNIETTEGAARCLLLTDLLRDAGALYDDEDLPNETYAHYLKAFTLYSDLFSHPTVDLEDHLSESELTERNTAMIHVADRLRALGAPAEVVVRIFAFYERYGAFAKAEDALFDLIGENGEDTDLLESGIAFYNRLLAKSDESLIAGDLPRSEVETSLQELTELLDEIA